MQKNNPIAEVFGFPVTNQGESATYYRENRLPTHVARLEFPRETGLMLRCAGKAGNPFQTTQETDTTGKLKRTKETIKLFLSKEARAELMKKQKDTRNRKHEDTTAVMKTEADATVIEQYGFQVTFNYPLIEEHWDSRS